MPHAGYGENAYYDRASKCSNSIGLTAKRDVSSPASHLHREPRFGHAVLDGLRPYFYESVGVQTAAFHEFLGNLTAMLMAFRNIAFRRVVLKESNGDLDAGRLLAGPAQRFSGRARIRRICAAR